MNNISVVNASAGSGKTYNLTYRVAEMLENGVEPENIMATTFTNRAAAELRERIRIQLLKNNQFQQANRINDGFIGTVNSICARLLKEYAMEAGISPAVVILPEEDSQKIFKISIDKVIDRYQMEMEPAARRLELDGRKKGDQKTGDWREHVQKMVDLARSNDMSTVQLDQCSDYSSNTISEILNEPIIEDLDTRIINALNLATSHLSKIEDRKVKTQNAYETITQCSKRFERNQQTWSDWVRLSKLDSAKDGQDIIAPVKDIAGQVLSHPQFRQDVQQIIQGTFDCAIESLQEYSRYKQENGLMDFIDQEAMVLDLVLHNKDVRNSLEERIRILLVDEFQDTSPIQLALFLALDQLAEESVWVGDPKQAIYGFRGTDPQLMNEVVSFIGHTEILDYSWRSNEELINCTNSIFGEVFCDMGKDRVCLKIPQERFKEAKGGELESWYLRAENKGNEIMAAANGVQDLLTRVEGIKPKDIAVLCRKNDYCSQLAAALDKIGIQASVGQGTLMETRECGVALAALRYMNDKNDTIALTELARFLFPGEQGSDSDWLSELLTDPEMTKETWNQNQLIMGLNEGRELIKYWTPLEALEQAINRIDLPNQIKSWPNHSFALNNLDTMRKICREYLDLCATRRSAATVQGFINYYRQSESEQAEGIGENSVNVLTYHKAKGLEWPWVILTGLNDDQNPKVYGVQIEAAPYFDPEHPLANRKVRYWPWPFGTMKKFPGLDEKIEHLPIMEIAVKKSVEEAQRLLYVGMTRAKDGMILVMRKTTTAKSTGLETGWLDTLKGTKGEVLIRLNGEDGPQSIRVGESSIRFTGYEYNSESRHISTNRTDNQ